MDTNNIQAVPEYVFEALEAVRQSGQTNMLDRRNVVEIADSMGFEDAAEYLDENRRQYGTILTQDFSTWIRNRREAAGG